MRNNSPVFTAIVLTSLLMIAHVIVAAQPIRSLNAYTDNHGIMHVSFNAELTQGINTLELPVDAVEDTLSVLCGTSELPWLFTDDGKLYIVSDKPCTATVNYVANVSVLGDVLTVKIVGDTAVKITLEREVLLLNIPETLISSTDEDGKLTIIVEPPATIKYTIAGVGVPTPTQTPATPPETTTPTQTWTTPPETTTPTTTPQPPTAVPTSVLIIILVVLVVILVVVARKK